MKIPSLLAAALAIGFAVAQDEDSSSTTSTSTSSSSTSSSRASSTKSSDPAIHTILVGKADHIFTPDSVKADVGDIITFEFYPANHSVVRSAYGFPCIPNEKLKEGNPGFFSGFQAIQTITDDMPQWNLTVNSTEPVFFYCSAPGSCINYGMVGAINPNSSTPVQKQHELAKQADYMLNPGEDFPAEEASSATSIAATVTATATPTPTDTAATATPIPAASHSGISGGAIAGIVIGAIVVLALLGALFYFVGRSKTLSETMGGNRARPNDNGDGASAYYAPTDGPSTPGLGHQHPAMHSVNGSTSLTLPPYSQQNGSSVKHPSGVGVDDLGALSVRSTSPPIMYGHDGQAYQQNPYGQFNGMGMYSPPLQAQGQQHPWMPIGHHPSMTPPYGAGYAFPSPGLGVSEMGQMGEEDQKEGEGREQRRSELGVEGHGVHELGPGQKEKEEREKEERERNGGDVRSPLLMTPDDVGRNL